MQNADIPTHFKCYHIMEEKTYSHVLLDYTRRVVHGLATILSLDFTVHTDRRHCIRNFR